MGTPKQRRNKTSRNQRRSHHALKQIKSAKCEKCGAIIKPHRACFSCGYYKGRSVIDVMKKLSPKERKAAAKAKSKEAGVGAKETRK